jgi:hypothetical protein
LEAAGLGEMKLAMACLSAALSDAPCAFIEPLSSVTRMAWFGTRLSASAVGVRLSALGLWHRAQFLSNSALPSGAVDAAG